MAGLKKDKIKTLPTWLFPALITALIFIVYGNSLKNKYSLDDEIVTSTYEYQNKRIEQGVKGIPRLFASRYIQTSQQSFSYRPLVLISFAIEYEFFKKNPSISHLINVLLYIATCLLLFTILKKVLSGYSLLLSLAITLIFIVHPLHTEVVCSIKNRDELMSFFFSLCALRMAIKYMDNLKIHDILLSAFFLWLAFLSKKTAIVFLLIIPATILFYKKIKIVKLIVPALIIFSSAGFFILIKKLMVSEVPVKRIFVFTENPLYYETGILNKIPMALYILGYYLKLMLLPYPLSCYYGYNTIPMAGWDSPPVWISLIIYSALTVFALYSVRKNNILGYGILVYLIAIFPYSNVIRPAVGIVAERFAFAATLGVSIVVGSIIVNMGKSNKLIPQQGSKLSFFSLVTGLFILIVFSGLTIRRNGDWKDQITLWQNDVKHFDDSQNLHLLIAKYLEKKIHLLPDGPEKNRKIQDVISHYQKVAGIVESGINDYPADFMSRNNLGTIYLEYLHNFPKAKTFFEQAIVINPEYAEAYYNLAFCYERMNQPDSAIKYYEKTLQLNVMNPAAHTHIYQQLLKTGDVPRMMEYSNKAIQSFPNHAEHYINLGNSYMMMRDTIIGIKYFEQGLSKEPENQHIRQQIINFLKSAGYPEKARALAE